MIWYIDGSRFQNESGTPISTIEPRRPPLPLRGGEQFRLSPMFQTGDKTSTICNQVAKFVFATYCFTHIFFCKASCFCVHLVNSFFFVGKSKNIKGWLPLILPCQSRTPDVAQARVRSDVRDVRFYQFPGVCTEDNRFVRLILG